MTRSLVLAVFLLLLTSTVAAADIPARGAWSGPHRSPTITPPIPQDSLDAWKARALAHRATRVARHPEPDGIAGIDTSTTHVRLDMPRVLDYVLYPVAADLDGNRYPEVLCAGSALTIYRDFAKNDVLRPETMPLPGYAWGLATGDLDGDGHVDVVVSIPDLGIVGVMRGRADGGLDTLVTFAAGPSPHKLVIADLDGDGRPDVAVACADSAVRVLRNHGDGSLEPPTVISFGYQPGDLAIADVDGDGRLDLVTVPLGWSPSPSWASCALNRGGSVFTEPVLSALPGPVYAIAAADLDGDGRADLAVSGMYGGWWMRGAADGSFALATMFSSRSWNYTAGVTIADLDGDGLPDIALAEPGVNGIGAPFSYFDMARVYRNLGAGTFEPGPGYHATNGMQSLWAGDVDGDGRPDLLAAAACWSRFGSPPPGVYVLLARPGLRYSSLAEYTGNGTSVHSPHAVHLGGSRDDLVDVSGGRVELRVNRDIDGFAPPVVVDRGDVAAVRDLDSDGMQDVIVQRGDSLDVLRGLAGHQLSSPRLAATGMGYFAIGAFTAAGASDLVLRDAAGALWIARGDGHGAFGPAVATGATLTLPTAGAGVDVDGDGRDELVLFRQAAGFVDRISGEHDADTVEVVRVDAGSPARSLAVVPVGWPAGTGWSNDPPCQVLAGDFDGDGRRDVFVFRAIESFPGDVGTYGVLLSRGGALVLTEVGRAPRSEASEATIVDLDGDGHDDVLISHYHSDDVGILGWLVSRGDGTFARGWRDDLGDYFYSVAVGRFDDDERPDVAVADGRHGYVGVIMNATLWPDRSTPVLASLVDATADPAGARLQWRLDAAPGTEAAVMRSIDGVAWTERARLRADGVGAIRFTDTEVTPGARYGYRLAVAEGAASVVVGETWLDIPRPAVLALAGAQPNPVVGDLVVAFSLAARTSGSLALFDLAGRRVATQDLEPFAAGEHRVRLAAAGHVPAGLYFIRLQTPGRTFIARAAVVR